MNHPEHDPYCVIYILGEQHCNCAEIEENEFINNNVLYEDDFED